MAYIRNLNEQTVYSRLPVIQSGLRFQMNISNQKANDHHDIIARVCHEEQKKLIWLLKEGRIICEHNARVKTME